MLQVKADWHVEKRKYMYQLDAHLHNDGALPLLLLGRIVVLPTYVDAAYCNRVTDRVACSVGLSVGRSVTLMSPAKTADTIEMPFRSRTRVGLRNRDRGSRFPIRKGQF